MNTHIFAFIVNAANGFNLFSICLRITLACLCGAALGIERAKSHQAAGLRTHMLVCLGAAVVMLTGEYMYLEYNTGDPARLGAQVISGIGFLGAGSIIMEGKARVRGLTTAAGLWTAACIGLAIGIGFYSGGVLATAAVWVISSKLKPVAHHYSRTRDTYYLYVALDNPDHYPDLFALVREFGAKIAKTEINKLKNEERCSIIFAVQLKTEEQFEELKELIGVQEYVYKVKELELEL